MKAIFCPRCNSSDIAPYAAGITGTYRCNNCGYIGSLVVEKTPFKQMREEEEEQN